MFGIFNLDSPIGRAMNMLADIMILSVLWVVCSLPVFTVGAATTALYYASMRSVRQEGSVFKDFFHAFRDGFRQSSFVTLIFAVIAVVIGADFWILSRIALAGENVLQIVLYGIILLLVMVASYLFPLLARYEANLKTHLKNAFLLSVSSPAITVILAALNIAPVLLFLWKSEWFFRLLPVISILWFGVAAHINSRLLLRLFARIQPEEL